MNNTMTQEISKSNQSTLSVFANADQFALAQRMAQAIASSTIVPTAYRGNIGNTLVALEVANRTGQSPFLVMQNLDIIEGKPTFNSKYVISAINTCGKFSALKYKVEKLGKKKVSYEYWTGEKPNRRKETGTIEIEDMSCVAYATDWTGEILESPKITVEMAVKEGWYTKPGSKWTTMPDLMIRYRAAAFFSRLHCPEVIMGMHTSEEALDGYLSTEVAASKPSAVDAINSKVSQKTNPSEVQDAEVIDEEIKPEPTKRTRKANPKPSQVRESELEPETQPESETQHESDPSTNEELV